MASHEFRTPLSTVQLSASLISKYAQECHNSNIEKHVEKIKSAVTNLTSILNDFLYTESKDINTVKPVFTTFNLAELGAEVTEEMQLLTKEGQFIKYSHQGEIVTVDLDKNLIKNSIINLLINAIKYSEEGTVIELRTRIDKNQCRIVVEDAGIGIPQQDHKHLFEPFYRAHNTGNIPGTGLGLTIVARYISLMNGTISFESTPHKGTVFTLLFPIQ